MNCVSMVVTPNQQRHFGPVQCVLMSRYQEAYDYYSQARGGRIDAWAFRSLKEQLLVS